ncbi:MAG: hypothetical protein Kow00128_10490 [Deltaproteobacteria bacterium]
MSEPVGITTDGSDLFVCDSGNNAIRRVSLADNSVSLLAGGAWGSADNDNGALAQFNDPYGITTDGTSLYVADFYMVHGGVPIPGEPGSAASLIRKIDLRTGALSTIAGIDNTYGSLDNTVGTSASFRQPSGLTTDGVSLFAADRMNQTVRRIR